MIKEEYKLFNYITQKTPSYEFEMVLLIYRLMKHIKPYQLFENNQEPQHPGFPETEEEIHELCEYYYI